MRSGARRPYASRASGGRAGSQEQPRAPYAVRTPPKVLTAEGAAVRADHLCKRAAAVEACLSRLAALTAALSHSFRDHVPPRRALASH